MRQESYPTHNRPSCWTINGSQSDIFGQWVPLVGEAEEEVCWAVGAMAVDLAGNNAIGQGLSDQACKHPSHDKTVTRGNNDV